MSYSHTTTETYTVADIETVARRFTADLVMIAQSSGAIEEAKARDYAHDVEQLAKKGYLRSVDLTLLTGGSGGTEVKATTFTVNTIAGGLTMSRPGGVLWPRVANPYLRIVLFYTSAYTDAARENMRSKLRIGWVPSSADTSHSTLKGVGGRDYASNGYGFQRLDFAA
jgi:hypothetical protein